MRCAESRRTLSLIAILPSVGRSNPATQSRSVDLPAPEGPKSTVIPGGTLMETSKTKVVCDAPLNSTRTRAVKTPCSISPATLPRLADRLGDLPHIRR